MNLENFHLNKSRADEVTCVCCGWQGVNFLPCPYGSEPHRRNSACPQCGSLERHRLYFLFLRDVIPVYKKIKVLHFAPEPSIKRLFTSYPNVEYISADLYQEDAMFKEDIMNLSFENDLFDIIFCSHVLEHVKDDRKAMGELYRVLKPGGFAILQVPVHGVSQGVKLTQTVEDSNITGPEIRKKLFGQEDHVRIYSFDYKDRLVEAGFGVDIKKYAASLGRQDIERYALLPEGDPSETDGWIYFCTK